MVRYQRSDRRSVGYLEKMHIPHLMAMRCHCRALRRWPWHRLTRALRALIMRAITISADADKGAVEPSKIANEVFEHFKPILAKQYPNVSMALFGDSEEGKTLIGLAQGAVLALLVIYALMAIPLKSYAQPLIIMSVILRLDWCHFWPFNSRAITECTEHDGNCGTRWCGGEWLVDHGQLCQRLSITRCLCAKSSHCFRLRSFSGDCSHVNDDFFGLCLFYLKPVYKHKWSPWLPLWHLALFRHLRPLVLVPCLYLILMIYTCFLRYQLPLLMLIKACWTWLNYGTIDRISWSQKTSYEIMGKVNQHRVDVVTCPLQACQTLWWTLHGKILQNSACAL